MPFAGRVHLLGDTPQEIVDLELPQRILDAEPTVIQVVPLTSRLRGFHSEVVVEPDPANGLDQSSAAQCQHLRAVSPARVASTLGNVGPLALSQIRETIAVIIDLP